MTLLGLNVPEIVAYLAIVYGMAAPGLTNIGRVRNLNSEWIGLRRANLDGRGDG
jgi:hypothetical protein